MDIQLIGAAFWGEDEAPKHTTKRDYRDIKNELSVCVHIKEFP